MIRVLSVAALLLAAAAPAFAGKQPYTLTGKVVKIADGDTLTILDSANTQHKIRLAGIDAPEKASRSEQSPGKISLAKCSASPFASRLSTWTDITGKWVASFWASVSSIRKW